MRIQAAAVVCIQNLACQPVHIEFAAIVGHNAEAVRAVFVGKLDLRHAPTQLTRKLRHQLRPQVHKLAGTGVKAQHHGFFQLQVQIAVAEIAKLTAVLYPGKAVELRL